MPCGDSEGQRPIGAPVFPTREGTHLDPSNVAARVLKPAARRAGVPWAGFHTFRHTCATMLFRHGLNGKQVQMWLGHHSPAFTLATYVHLLADDLPDPGFLDQITARPTVDASRSGSPLEVASGAAESRARPETLGFHRRTKPTVRRLCPSPGRCGTTREVGAGMIAVAPPAADRRIVPLRPLELWAGYLVGTARSERGLVAGTSRGRSAVSSSAPLLAIGYGDSLPKPSTQEAVGARLTGLRAVGPTGDMPCSAHRLDS